MAETMISSPGWKVSVEAKLRKSWVVEGPRTTWSARSAMAASHLLDGVAMVRRDMPISSREALMYLAAAW
jgi:hypothetical protein